MSLSANFLPKKFSRANTKLPIGYAIKREGKSKWGFYIYRHLLDQEKERLGIG